LSFPVATGLMEPRARAYACQEEWTTELTHKTWQFPEFTV